MIASALPISRFLIDKKNTVFRIAPNLRLSNDRPDFRAGSWLAGEWDNISLLAEPVIVNKFYASETIGRAYERGNISGRFSNAFIRYKMKNSILQLGRAPVWWGQSFSSSIIQSGAAQPYDHIDIKINFNDFQFDLLAGQLTSDTAPIFFDSVRVPQRYCIGKEGEGFKIQMQHFQEERIFLSASILIVLEKCISKTIEFCQDRHAFGKAIIENQSIQFRLAELQTEVEALRALIYQACEIFTLGKDMTYLASMAKLKSGRLAREVSDTCLQYWGGMGFTWENPVSKIYRDSRVSSIAGGTDEIMLQIICKKMDLL